MTVSSTTILQLVDGFNLGGIGHLGGISDDVIDHLMDDREIEPDSPDDKVDSDDDDDFDDFPSVSY
jgi:hypothetical protein